MGTSTGPAGELLALPKGGGALRPLGERFAADSFTGGGAFSLPLALPEGRGGFGPRLVLSYGTQQGDGFFGLGWSLALPRVERRCSRGIPRYTDDDVLLLQGEDELVEVAAAADVTTFRPRTETAFARIERLRDATGDTWRITALDGTVTLLGRDPTDRARAATVADPGDERRVLAWLPTEQQDLHGNRVVYRWTRVRGEQGSRRWDEVFLSAIEYVERAPGRDDFLISVQLRYESRPDPLSQRRGGFEVRTMRRCTAIEVHSRAEGDAVVKRWELGYAGPSRLTRIRLVGVDGAREEPLAPIVFGYTPFDPSAARVRTLSVPDLPTRDPERRQLELIDVDGGGLPSFVAFGGFPRVWKNLGGGRFQEAVPIESAPAQVFLDDGSAQLLDAEGNGRLDLMVLRGQPGVFPLRFRRMWSAGDFRAYAHAPGDPLADPEVRFVDLDGDGITDALRTGDDLQCFFQDAERGWAEVRTVPRGPVEEFPDVQFASSHVKLADMTGDGLQDIVSFFPGRIECWPARGRGDFGPRVILPDPRDLPPDVDPERIFLVDVDGDGASDLVHVESGQVTVWLNQAGVAWSEPHTIPGTPTIDGSVSVRPADLLGTGAAGLLFLPRGGPPQFLDFSGGHKPHLLATIENHRGARTRIQYASSSQFFAADESDGERRWRTSLPFPVPVVVRVTVEDTWSQGKVTTDYRYRHGHWDPLEREFRGFGRVDTFEVESFADPDLVPAPLIETRTWFHLGAVAREEGGIEELDLREEAWAGDPVALERSGSLPAAALRSLRGRTLRTEIYVRDGSPLAERPHAVSEAAVSAVPVDGAFAPFVEVERTATWERGTEPMELLTFHRERDDIGQELVRVEVAVPRGRDWRRAAPPGEPYLARVTTTRYAMPDDRRLHLRDRVAARTVAVVANDGSLAARDLVASLLPREVISQEVHRYDGDPFVGLPAGRVGARGVRVRTERLALTEAIVRAAYGASQPPYLAAQPSWTPEYPDGFRGEVGARGGYLFHDGDELHERGWFALTEQRAVDARGLIVARKQAVGEAQVDIAYDRFGLFPVRCALSDRLVTTARHDYRVFRIAEHTDANGTTARVTYTPSGEVATIERVGADGARTSFVEHAYDLAPEAVPLSVRTTRHVGAERLITVEFSDGLGRLLQTRHQAEAERFGDARWGGDLLPSAGSPAPRQIAGFVVPGAAVVVSGAGVFDGKGRTIAQTRPYFSSGFAFAPPTREERRGTVRSRHDAVGRLIRRIDPDGVEQRIVYGVPRRLSDPDDFEPTPWERYSYDGNDNAGRTHATEAAAYGDHFDTPSSVGVDALGRTILAREHAGAQSASTRSEYDAAGNLARVIDALGRTKHEVVCDLLDPPTALRATSLDGGVRRVAVAPDGEPLELRDSSGGLTLYGRDRLRRTVAVWGRDAEAEPVTLRERLVWGDASPVANARGRLIRHEDEAGAIDCDGYDADGRLLERRRWVVADDVLGQEGWVIDWSSPPPLEPAPYLTSYRFDELGRVKTMVAPADARGHRARVELDYDLGGAPIRIAVDGAPVLERMAYDALGRPVLELLGNGVLTRQAYDERLRLARSHSQRVEVRGLTLTARGEPICDVGYEWDLVGNLRALDERGAGVGLASEPDRLRRDFQYDPRYRLIEATGRECDAPLPPRPWEGQPRSCDPGGTRAYRERYDYDAVGNLVSLAHLSSRGNFTRAFQRDDASDRLTALTVDGTAFAQAHDASGNLTGEGTSRHFAWDRRRRLRDFREGAGAAPSVRARFLADSEGRRVKKWVVRQNGEVETLVTIDETFTLRRRRRGAEVLTASELRISSHSRCLAVLRAGDPLPEDRFPATTYWLDDHLGSASIVLDRDGGEVARTEYTPYGEISRGTVALDRYGHGGKPRDAETGLYDYGARPYRPWAGRFVVAEDVSSGVVGNAYGYVGGNPMSLVDPDGHEEQPSRGCTRDDLRRYMQMKTPALPFIFGPARVKYALRDQTRDIRCDYLRFHAGVQSRGLEAAATMGNRLAGAVSGFVIGGYAMMGLALAAPAAAPAYGALAAKANGAGIWFAVHFPKTTAVTLALLAGAANIPPTPAAPAASRGVWALEKFQRGRAIHTMLGENLPGTFPAIDRAAQGVGHVASEIASIKSIDLTLKSYQPFLTTFGRLAGHIDAVARFDTATWQRVTVTAGRETARFLDVAIEPGVATFTQQLELLGAKLLAGMRGVQLNVHQVR